MLVIKLILNLKISGLERKAIEGNLALKGLNRWKDNLNKNAWNESKTSVNFGRHSFVFYLVQILHCFQIFLQNIAKISLSSVHK